MVSARARREQVDYAVGRGASVRRSCALLQVSRSALGYVSAMPARDAELAAELTQISAAHASYGHRFAWALIRRGGWSVNKKRARRVSRLLGLDIRREKSSPTGTQESR
jgi:putative transposase